MDIRDVAAWMDRAIEAEEKLSEQSALLKEAIEAIKALMYRFHPAGQTLEPGTELNEKKVFKYALEVLRKHKAYAELKDSVNRSKEVGK